MASPQSIDSTSAGANADISSNVSLNTPTTPAPLVTPTDPHQPAYCLISGGGLHFSPYRGDTRVKGRQPYLSFLASKTVSSLSPSANTSSDNESLPASFSSSSSLENSKDYVSSEKDSSINSLLNHYATHALYLPSRYIEPESGTNSDEIKRMLFKIFPHWKGGRHESSINVKQLTGGITNMLLECSKFNRVSQTEERVLVRTYGRGTSLIIDRDREFVSHLVINSVGLAPPIHARFGNGLVYGYIEGRSLEPEEMSSPSLYPLIASKLGEWHQKVRMDAIEEGLHKLRKEFNSVVSASTSEKPSNIWSLISNWIQILPEIDGIVKTCQENSALQAIQSKHTSLRETLEAELEWLRNQLAEKSPNVASHCDLLSGNIIVPHELSEKLSSSKSNLSQSEMDELKEKNPLSFIDYEYMTKAPRAFDISNHLLEWQGFDCDKSRIPEISPTNEVLRNWCSSYLNLPNDRTSSEETMIDELISEISIYFGLPGFYWGIWAGIQSGISLIDFDYSWYSGERFAEYWNWKKDFLANQQEI